MGMWKARTDLVAIDEAKGREELKDVNLSTFELKP